MEVDGMYENTPWEHIARWAPWLGLGVLLLAIVMYQLAKRRETAAPDTGLAVELIAGMLGALGLSLATIGVLFCTMWRAAHATYPHHFGRTAVGLAIGVVVVALLVGLLWRVWRTETAIYGMLTASVAITAAIAAFSHSIIAEGQVTAMALPVGYIVCAIGATAVASLMYRDAILYEAACVLTFIALAFVATRLLPVVQFRDDTSGNTYPVTGAFYIVALGRIARMWVIPPAVKWGMLIATIAIGYLLASWYGIAIAAVGLSISGALDPRRLPSAESPPQRLTPV
jgi:hypothetical protein